MSLKKVSLLLIVLLQVAVIGAMISGIYKFGFEPIHLLYIELGAVVAVVAISLMSWLLYALGKFMYAFGSALYVIETVALIAATIYVCAAIDNTILAVAMICASAIMSLGLIPVLCRKN